MQRFAVVLFALVAVFAIGVPSSAKALAQVKRETNADRFARGLPPLTPSRRSTAKRTQHSHASVSHSCYIQVRDHGSGQTFGYLQNGPTGPGGINTGNNPDHTDLFARYNSAEKSIFCLGSHFSQGGSYLGALIGPLSADSTNYVPITNGDIGNPNYEAAIWSIDQSGKLSALYKSAGGSIVVVGFAYNSNTNIIVLVGDIGNLCSPSSGWKQVDIYMVN